MGRHLIQPHGAIDWLPTHGSIGDVRQLQEHGPARAALRLPTTSRDLP
jgi:hypothetical protein